MILFHDSMMHSPYFITNSLLYHSSLCRKSSRFLVAFFFRLPTILNCNSATTLSFFPLHPNKRVTQHCNIPQLTKTENQQQPTIKKINRTNIKSIFTIKIEVIQPILIKQIKVLELLQHEEINIKLRKK